MRQAKRRAGLHGGEDAGVHLRLRGVGDEQHHEVGLGDDVEGLAERAVLLGEATRAPLRWTARRGGGRHTLVSMPASFSESRKFWPCAGAGSPADDADGVDALERLGKLLEEVAAAAHDVLALAGDVHELLLENFGVDVEVGVLVAALAATTRRASATAFAA